MDDFFQYIKNRLEKRSGTPYEDQYWKLMEAKLDQHQPKPIIPFSFKYGFFTALGVIAILLGISFHSLFLTNEIGELSKKQIPEIMSASSAEECIDQNENKLEPLKSFALSDSVHKPKSIQVPYRKPDKAPTKVRVPSKDEITYSNEQNIAPNPQLNNEIINSGRQYLAINQVEENSVELVAPQKINYLPFQKGGSITTKMVSPNPLPIYPVASLPFKKEPNSALSPKIRLKGIDIGLLIGGLWLATDSLESENSLSVGIQANLRLTSSFRIWGQISGMAMNYETTTDVSSLGIPKWKPDTPTYKLAKVEVERTGIFYSGGLAFVHPIGRKMETYLGLGYGGGHWLPYAVSYEYDDEQTDEYEGESEDISIPQSKVKDAMWQVQVGLAYQLKNNWQVILQADYKDHIIPRSSAAFPGILDLQAGLAYRIGSY